MATTNVSSCVLSILGSFSGGTDVFKKLREQRGRMRRRSRKNATMEQDEQRLSRSLRQGPEDIGREYQRNVYAVGHDFEIGDVIAQTSLAEILLKLNTGLVGIIASFLNHDKRNTNIQLDYHSLTDLSERSRVNTCRTLRQLFKRMAQRRIPLAIAAKEDSEVSRRRADKESGVESSRKNRKGSTKVKGPTLARVVIQNSSRPSQIAMVKPGERRKNSHSSSGSGSSSLSKADSGISAPPYTPPPAYSPQQSPRPSAQRSHTTPDWLKPHRKHSSGNVAGSTLTTKSDALRATKSTPGLQSTLPPEHLPPLPKTAPLPITNAPPVLPRRRKPTYSMASDTTKLGEIPLHKWAVPYDFEQMSILNREAERNGWPLNQLDDSQVTRKKRFGFFRWFGRKVD